MADDPRIEQLLDELLDFHRTPEEVCDGCPELLPVVRNRWRQICRVRADLDLLFPPPPSCEPTPQFSQTNNLPRVPGYEVESILGRGGMGIVFRARHLRLNRPVALKMALEGQYAGPHEKQRFQREAEAVAGLRHPNVVQVFDVGDVEGRPYFTMEFMDGGNLAQKLAGTPQPACSAAELVMTLAGAVHAAHLCGIIHRDLKPANVLLTAEGIVKICDFGLARRLGDSAGLTRSGAPVGTPSYMAPEQARGLSHDLGPTVDVYALGCILYELLTGRPPFRAATAAETIQQVISQEPAHPSRLNDKVPRDLDTICLKCLRKESERRYTSAQALGDDLRRFGEGRPIQARPAGWVERSWRWSKRNPTGAALVATALALVMLVSGGGVWIALQRARQDGALRSDVGTALTQAASLRKGLHFQEAREMLEQAQHRLSLEGPDDLRERVKQAQKDLNLAENLDKARLSAALLVDEVLQPVRAEPLYVSAFVEAGLGREGDDIKVVATRVRNSELYSEIISAIDDWASITRDLTRRKWLLDLAREADPDPVRNRLRDPELWKNPERLKTLTLELKNTELSPQLAIALGMVSRLEGMDFVAILTPVLKHYPQDFWLHFRIGLALQLVARWEACLGHFRAALALRPKYSACYNAMGMVYWSMGQVDEATFHFRESIRLAPDDANAFNSFGVALSEWGKSDEGILHLQQAIRLEPQSVAFRRNLGVILRKVGRLDESIDALQQAVRIQPRHSGVLYGLGHSLYAKGRLDEAIDCFQQAVMIDPKNTHFLNMLGVCLSTKDRLEEACDCFRQVIRLEPENAAVHLNLGDALRRGGRLEEAIEVLQKAVSLDPKLTTTPGVLGSTMFQAARTSILATAGLRTEMERAEKRRKALAWLRANLDLRSRLLSEGKAVDWSVINWQSDPAWFCVRDAAELSKLPDADREEWLRLWKEVAAIVATDPRVQGSILAARGEWAKAAECYAQSLKRGPAVDGHFWYEYTSVLLLSGDHPGYVKGCARMIETCGKEGGPRAYHVARACTLAADSVADAMLPGRLAEKELRSFAQQFWSLTEQGALAYRAGRFQDAVPLFELSLKANPKEGAAVVNWLWLALANHRLGKNEEANCWLFRAQTWLDQYRDGMPPRVEQEFGLHLHNWLEAHVLRREAETLINLPQNSK